MASARTPQSLQTSLARLAGARPRAARETRIFKFTVTASDGKKCSVNVRVSPKRVYDTTLKQLANELRVPLEKLDEVLDDWTNEELIAHLSRYPSRVLDSLPQERRFLEYDAGA